MQIYTKYVTRCTFSLFINKNLEEKVLILHENQMEFIG